MAVVPLSRPVRLGDLQVRSPVSSAAAGLEGEVFVCENTPFLFKRFASPMPPPEARALQRVIEFRESGGSVSDRRAVRELFAWPLHRVLSGRLTVGVMLPAAEPRFYFRLAGAWHLREGQHLPRPSSAAGVFEDGLRLQVLLDLATAMTVLDRNGLVWGDANSRNLAFAEWGRPQVVLLDCDGIRPAGGAPTRFQPRWRDPWQGPTVSVASDRYLFALWVLRVLSRSMVMPSTKQVDLSGLPRDCAQDAELREVLRRGLGRPADRPPAAAFVPVLVRLARRAAA